MAIIEASVVTIEGIVAITSRTNSTTTTVATIRSGDIINTTIISNRAL